ncbi:IS5 family transposase [Fimbriiglobus ruber]|uniref:IS5 family transposase n=1 Tax=Fimbriiglobus ruber TaxID=1908690 RepID=UPI000B4B3F5D
MKAKKIGRERSATARGLGRSRGGFSTKVVATASDENTALVVEVVPGPASDATRLEPMLDKTLDRVPVIDELDADKGFDGDQQRHACTARGVFANIPNKKNRVRPWAFDPVGYRERNRVERLIGKMKQFRRVDTRYEKLKTTFLGLIHLVLGFIKVKSKVNQKFNTT